MLNLVFGASAVAISLLAIGAVLRVIIGAVAKMPWDAAQRAADQQLHSTQRGL